MPQLFPLSARIIDAIIRWEVSSREHYERNLMRPCWPAEMSGVTIGIGYDLGYQTRDGFMRDWSAHLNKDEIETLLPCVGVKGAAAEPLVRRVADEITIPWASAVDVFRERTIPRYIDETMRAFPGIDKAPHTDCLGVLVSLVMNRGGGMGKPGDDRRSEMRLIRSAVAAEDWTEVPLLLREMKRLWPKSRGLRDRRDEEAQIFDEALTVAAKGALRERWKEMQQEASSQRSRAAALRIGDTGEKVRAVQAALVSRGYALTLDGIFGPATKREVELFQRAQGLKVDGIIGPATLAAINI